MKIPVNTKHMKLFECLSSETRIKILEILVLGPKNIGELAGLLNVSSAIMTRHISMMEEAGIIATQSIPGKRGLQKVCSLSANEIVLYFKENCPEENWHYVSIPVGQYLSYEVRPTCGLASREGYIGLCDDPRYFSDPKHVNASLLWFQTGYVDYRIPSYSFSSRSVEAIEISLEICSEFSGYNEDWPSDIHFYLNNTLVGIWQSPGDFGSIKGTFTPDWWKGGSQHGLLKTIRITAEGSMIDGIRLSDTKISDIALEKNKDLFFKISVPRDAKYSGGVNIFGKGFGNYDQDIEVRIKYA